MDYSAALHTAIDISHEAGTIIRAAFPETALSTIVRKGPVNPVTDTDTAAEDVIVSRLRTAFPAYRILAEEGGGDDALSAGPPIWVIDPLDGTNNFAHGFPHVGISMALVVDREPVVGVIYDPLRNETFAAVANGGAARNGRLIRVSQVEWLEDAFLATGFAYDRRTAIDNNTERLDHFLRRSQGVRRAGAAVLDLAYVACGRLDGFWELRLNPWDVAAGILIVREAGGWATNAVGSPDCISGDFIVASNGRIHAEMLRVIREGAEAPRPE
ncbi:MAG: inositol monophosphatase [Chloroflexi bacterium]|nr:inositol monophosphatase [Chloroflexota bacterium]